MRVEVKDFNVRVEGNVTEEHPKQYDAMKLIYAFSGNNLEEEKLRKAIDLSMERYCGVSAVYKKAMQMSYEIEIK
jgi:putative redox protein